MPRLMIILNIIASVVWLFQIVFAFLSYRRNKKIKTATISGVPKLSIIIPAYNESEYTVQKVVDSIVAQKGVELEVFVIDDGSDKPLTIQEHSKVKSLRLAENSGKRKAQMHAIKQAKFEWIVTIDSDTTLAPNALIELYKAAVNQKVNSITGNVFVKNEKENFLTRMTSCLYWYGFEQERASQSYFGQVTCCSGALALFKKSIILEVEDLYLNQKFLGKSCDTGDDRFLTCLFSLKSEKIGYAPKAIAYTISPATVKEFTKQQIRWSRSNTPAMLFVLKNWKKIPLTFIAFMWTVMFRYGYFAILHVHIWTAILIRQDPNILWGLFLSVIIIGAIKGIVAYCYTRNIKFALLVPLSIFTLVALSPVVIFGAMTPSSVGWLTRTKKGIVQK